jgi:type II secretion system (T2SS) protein M
MPIFLQQLLAALLFVLCLGCFWTLMFGPLLWLFQAQQVWRGEMQNMLAADRGWIAQQSHLDRERADAKSAPMWRRFYAMTVANDLSGEVQRDAMGLLGSMGAGVEKVEALPVAVSHDLNRGGVRLSASLTIEQLTRLLRLLKSHEPYLRVERLQVKAPQVQETQSNAALSVTLEVFGYGASGSGLLRKTSSP